ncbi:unnamed protein product [Mytilus coruscus]|uniref:Letm1 RBD domain-containing protein n=1 Tax=Mytilus coruscus TaxID=42192 RepID=A0A6J8DPT2_MYTCO|nr:unnamed protein product [Mytilus coruscus]
MERCILVCVIGVLVLSETTGHSLEKRKKRYYCSHPQDTLGPPGRLKRYLINKFVKTIEKCENFVETNNPSAFKFYKTFKVGFNDLLEDTKTYYQVSKDIWYNSKELHTFSRKELVIYQQMPNEMIKAAPMLVVAMMPGAFVVFPTILPIAYLYPKLLLTSHFWTEEIKKEVYEQRHIDRIKHLPLILDHMEIACRHIPHTEYKLKMEHIFHKLENSLHPTVEEILEVKPVFETYNFKAEKLSFAYSRHLAKTFGFSLRRSKLVQEGLILLHTDLAIVREGFNSMTEEDINMSCLSRGLNPYGMKRDEKENYLESWTQISKEVDEHSMSLLLHGPVLLALNHPTNRHLLGGKKFRWRRKKKKEV